MLSLLSDDIEFLINQNQLTAAVTEECNSVEEDVESEPSSDVDDLETDLYQACQSCSLATSKSQSKREELMIINLCSRKYMLVF